jgi:hypothetical protein
MVSKRWLQPAIAGAIVAFFLLSLSFVAGPPSARSQVPNGAAEEVAGRRSCDFPAFSPTSFSASTTIDNLWLPLLPGTQRVLAGTANTSDGVLPRRIVTTVTNLTKLVDGVRSVVLYEEDFTGGVLSEAEIAFVAQDDLGNVWNMGEHPAVFEGGGSTGASQTWISGVDGAQAGIRMPGAPSVDLPRFSQGFAPNAGFFDCGQVVQTGATVCILISTCYGEAVVINENSPLDSGNAIQQKSYAPNVGLVKVDAIADPEAETLELVSVQRLGAEALAEVNFRALLLEESAYRLSPAYQQTGPIEQ